MNQKDLRVPFRSLPDNHLLVVQRLWTQLQTVLNTDRVLRWQRFAGLHAGIRNQNLMEHSFSITALGGYVLERLRPFFPNLKRDLVLLALPLHDIGEAILGRDVSFVHKTSSHDVDEYEAFKQVIRDLPPEVQETYMEAFLLQFCLDKGKWDGFDEEAQAILRSLASCSLWEARVFNLIEHVDYLMFMLEAYEAGNDYLLYHTLTSTEIKFWKELIPGIREAILPVDLYEWCLDFVANYEAGGGETKRPEQLK